MMLPTLIFLAALIDPADVAVPYRQPQLAAAHGQVAMAFGAGTSIYVAASTDGGRSFLAPRKVVEVGTLALGRHRGPRLAILKTAMVVSAIVGERQSPGLPPHGSPESGNLRVWRSTDGGLTWEPGGRVNDVPSAAREGLHAMAASPDGSLFAAWLDLRDKGTRLYGSRSNDGGRTWQKNVLLYESPDGTICQCCHPTLAYDDAGRLFAMWRNVIDGSRDLYYTTSTDGLRFAAARKLGTGTWKLNACPMDGGALAAADGKWISAWRREGDIYLADANSPEKGVGAGKDVALAQGRRGTYLAWTQEAALKVLTPQAAEPQLLAPAGAFASLVRLPDGAVLAAWESNGSLETRRLD